MNLLKAINPMRLFRQPAPMPTAPLPAIRARYDSQFTTDENERHWALADAMSADASASYLVRRTLRMRSRYEVANNSYARGITSTIANYVIGTGPRVQVHTDSDDFNDLIENLWAQWSRRIDLATKMRTSRLSRFESGECFWGMYNNPGLDFPVKLDVKLFEADQVTSPLLGMYPAQYADQFFDGIELDPYGNRKTYHILKQHPGALGAFTILGYQFDPWAAKYVIHDYRPTRPGQQRGVPEIVPALPLFAQLRRYTLAVLGAAETAADFAAVMKSNGPAVDDKEPPDPMDTIPLRSRMMTVLPAGWDINQIDAKQPTTSYDGFTNSILREISRCLDFPLFFASLDANQANMSSAYVVTQPFYKSVAVDREGYNCHLDRLFNEFVRECQLIGLLPRDIPPEAMSRTWRWPRLGNHADPQKTAMGRQIDLASGATSIPLICAEEGHDWEEVQESAAQSLGMTLDEYRAALRAKVFGVPGVTPQQGQPGQDPVDPNDTEEVTTDASSTGDTAE